MINLETIIQMVIVAVVVYLVLKNLYGSEQDNDAICNYCHNMNQTQEEETETTLEAPTLEDVIMEESAAAPEPVAANEEEGTIEAFSQPAPAGRFSSSFASY